MTASEAVTGNNKEDTMDVSKFTPLGDYVLIKPHEQKTTTSGGIHLPDSVTKDGPIELGVIVAVGPGKLLADSTTRAPISVKVGDTVLFSMYAGSDLKGHAFQGRHVLMHDDALLGVFVE